MGRGSMGRVRILVVVTFMVRNLLSAFESWLFGIGGSMPCLYLAIQTLLQFALPPFLSAMT